MSDEQMYRFLDKSGQCFDDFADVKDSTDYHRRVAFLLNNKTFSVGDMMCFRDDLINDGFVWGKDFFVQKVQ